MYRDRDSSRPFYECLAAVAVDRHHRCISEKSSEFHGVSDVFPLHRDYPDCSGLLVDQDKGTQPAQCSGQ